jgi:ABC-type transport system involved in cytochrome bd biosynthesis fused ATPase/permease subunit
MDGFFFSIVAFTRRFLDEMQILIVSGWRIGASATSGGPDIDLRITRCCLSVVWRKVQQ